MAEIQLGIIESRFADIIWQNEPIKSSDLVRIAAEKFNWKRTTTHTVIKRLCDKGIFINNSGTVTSLIPREQFYSLQSKQFVDNSFDGSLPAFIAAFTRSGSISQDEAAAIRRMIDEAVDQ